MPRYIVKKSIALYFLLLIIVSLLFPSYIMKWYWFIFGIAFVFIFFNFSNKLYSKWENISNNKFRSKLFTTSLIIRVLYVFITYLFYTLMTGQPFEFGAADSLFYNNIGEWGHDSISHGNYNLYKEFGVDAGKMSLSDFGYPLYLSVIYTITDNSIIIVRLLKAIYGSYIVTLTYKIASRNFGEKIGRLSAIFCMLMPNLIFYCNIHTKEIEMLLITLLFIERADFILHKKTFSLKNILILFLIGIISFSFRTILGVVLFLSFFVAIVLSSNIILNKAKKVLLSLVCMLFFVLILGGPIYKEVDFIWQNKNTNQESSMQLRSIKKGGNEFAKYAGAAVFAPLIFTIPFPTMVETEGQENQRMIHGGNYVKNITSFFTILSLFLMIFVYKKEWKKYVLPLSFMLGYLVVIALSAFAHSERFHLPALPFALMFAAYAVVNAKKKYLKYFDYWLVLIFVANVAWAWFKLAGRGMI